MCVCVCVCVCVRAHTQSLSHFLLLSQGLNLNLLLLLLWQVDSLPLHHMGSQGPNKSRYWSGLCAGAKVCFFWVWTTKTFQDIRGKSRIA